MVGDRYVGFYWTRPVNWAEFRYLSRDVDEAAKASITIRYQRDRVRAWVREDGGRLVTEAVFIDVRTDRATEAITSDLDRLKLLCRSQDAKFVYVNFNRGWRSNNYLTELERELGDKALALPPDPIVINGTQFDPKVHFSRWRDLNETKMRDFQDRADLGMREALAAHPPAGYPDGGRWAVIADKLNMEGIRTVTGGRWSAENVRQTVKRYYSGR